MAEARGKRPKSLVLTAVKGAAVAGGVLALCAIMVRSKTRQAERLHPPVGQFLEVDGVRLHYLDRGRGAPLVVLHGNGESIESLQHGGLLDQAAQDFRVIAFDRPGFGHSARPRHRIWTARAQAHLLRQAFRQAGIDQPIILAHGTGAQVALALALDYPDEIRGLVLMSGYYYPSLHPGLPLLSLASMPVVGDIIRHTVSPLLGRLMWQNKLAGLFGAKHAPGVLAENSSAWMAQRPIQLAANAGESALMIPSALALSKHYHELGMPITLITGTGGEASKDTAQAERFQQVVNHSKLVSVEKTSPTLHYFAVEPIMKAVHAMHNQASWPRFSDSLFNKEEAAKRLH